MPRYRRSLALRPINRIKHVVDGNSVLAAGTALPNTLILSVDAPVLGTPQGVVTGSKCYGIYLKVLVASNEATVAGAIPNVYMYVIKSPAGDLVNPAANLVGASDLKKYVVHQEMSMIENRISGIPTVLFNGVIKFPKGYVRNGPNDKWILVVLCPSINITVCYQGHYKEFR